MNGWTDLGPVEHTVEDLYRNRSVMMEAKNNHQTKDLEREKRRGRGRGREGEGKSSGEETRAADKAR